MSKKDLEEIEYLKKKRVLSVGSKSKEDEEIDYLKAKRQSALDNDAKHAKIQEDSGSIAKTFFPSAYEQFTEAKKSMQYSPLTPSSVLWSGGLLMNAIMDVGDIGKRYLGGDMEDPESNIWEGPRKKMRDWISSKEEKRDKKALEEQAELEKYKNGHWTDQLPDWDPDKYIMDPRRKSSNADLKTLRIMGDTFFEQIGDPFVIKGLIQSTAKGMMGIAEKGIDAAQRMRKGFHISPAGATDEGILKKFNDRKNIELIAQQNPMTRHIPEKMQQENMEQLQKTITEASTSRGGQPVRGIDETITGERVSGAAEGVEKRAGELYQKGEDIVTKPIAQEKVLRNPPKTNVLLSAKELAEKPQSIATNKVDEMFKNIGHTPGDEIKNIGEVSDKTIAKGMKYRRDIESADTIEELINAKRNIATETFEDMNKGLFTGEKNKGFLKGMNSKINEAVEETILKVMPGKVGKDFQRAYQAINDSYSKTVDLMDPVASKLNIGKKNFREEDVFSKIRLIGSKNLKNIKEASKTDPNIKPLMDELSRGAFDSVIKKSLNKDRLVSPDKFVTEWNKISHSMKETLFDKKLIGDMDEVAEIIEIGNKSDLMKFNPSGTSRAINVMSLANLKGYILGAAYRYLTIKHYYKTGKTYRESAANLIPKTGKKVHGALDNKTVKRILKTQELSNYIKAELREE